MAMKAVKCTQCGSDLELDGEREFGFCGVCGTKIMLFEQVKHVHSGTISLDNSNEISNCMKMADSAYEIEDYVEAHEYYSRVLELNSESYKAHFMKGLCKFLMSVSVSKDSKLLIQGYENAKELIDAEIKSGSEAGKSVDAYQDYLKSMIQNLLSVTDRVYKLYNYPDTVTYDSIDACYNHFFDRYQVALMQFNILTLLVKEGVDGDDLKKTFKNCKKTCLHLKDLNMEYFSHYDVKENNEKKEVYKTLRWRDLEDHASYSTATENIDEIIEFCISTYAQLPSILNAGKEYSEKLKRLNVEREELEKEANQLQEQYDSGTSEFWENNPETKKMLKKKKRLSWIAVAVGFIVYFICYNRTEPIGSFDPETFGRIMFVVGIIVKMISSRIIGKNFEKSVFGEDLLNLKQELDDAYAKLGKKEDAIDETESELEKFNLSVAEIS